jgi:ectoine hydroxylase-related dioxygenase (phytanoyl-CoA dioxygenase family)
MVDAFHEHLYQPVTQAGDVVIWSEATVHGATPWKADHQRRIALYRFSPANMGYGRGYLEIDPARLEGMTDAQRAVLQPPYATRLERPVVAVGGSGDVQVQIRQRSEEKKQLDMELFGTKYF